MKLLTVKNQIKTEKQFPGLIACEFTHEIKSASANIEYLGPPISVEAWNQILAFFQWTYDTTKSESQVRMFVNTNTKVWQGWAFPQEARTGMTARELDTPDKAKQREQFADSEGWVYFGTIHHHCSASAFQSSTDLDNEKSQDGLHITIGNMASARYDMHVRFYLGGFGFEPDMSRFWDVGEFVRQQTPPAVWDSCARHQMCQKAPITTEYPAQWRENLIEVKTTFPIQTGAAQGTTVAGNGGYYSGGQYYPGHQGGRFQQPDKDGLALWMRAKRAVGELTCYFEDNCHETDTVAIDAEVSGIVHALAEGIGDYDLLAKICELCCEWHVTPMEMWQEIPADNDLDACVNSWMTHMGNYKGRSSRKAPADTGPTKEEQKKLQAGDDQYGMYGHMMD